MAERGRLRWSSAGLASMVVGAAIFAAVAAAYGTARPIAKGRLLDAVVTRGTLVVGVREYARPAPPKAPTLPAPDHFDVAMARFMAQRLGVDLRVVGLPGEPGSRAWQAAQRDVDVVLAGAADAHDGMVAVPSAYAVGPGRLLVQRGSTVQRAEDLRAQAVCVAQGSPYVTHLVRTLGAKVRVYGSSIRAASRFLAGECQALADDSEVLQRLLTLQEWRFYRPLQDVVPADEQRAQIAMRIDDAQSAAWLAQAVREWRRDGALARAREQRAGDVAFEASQLQDGLVCHS